MEQKRIKKAIERRNQVEKILENDENGKKLLRGLTFSAFDYIDSTLTFEAHRRKLKDCERFIDDSTEVMVEMDLNKRRTHNALISKLNSFNRYLFNTYPDSAPIGGIYTLEPPESIRDRNKVGDWAGYYVFGLKNGDKN
ncbi:MAG TPA: DUF3232 domain-containing protein [Candidatus Pacearchaeota archaeon]|nr:DUF3232 domain-containing protein [Candidatus Pacearchaeota archaeon]